MLNPNGKSRVKGLYKPNAKVVRQKPVKRVLAANLSRPPPPNLKGSLVQLTDNGNGPLTAR
jgi:hypothetical protein